MDTVKLRLQLWVFSATLELGIDQPEDLTVDLVGTHRDIPVATYDAGFRWPDE